MIVLWTILVVAITDSFGYWGHRALHQSWTGPLNEAHMSHHLKLYPPSDFSSNEYRDAGKDSTTWTFLGAGLPLLLSPVVACILGFIGILTGIWLATVISVIGLMHAYIHDWLHLNMHWFHRIPGAKHLIEIHRVHHIDMSKNFGIFTFFWDRIAGTYETK